MDNTIHDIHGILDLIKEGKIEPITMWKYYVSKWDIEEQRILLIKLIGISTKEKREFRQGSDLDRIASYHSSYLSRKINEITPDNEILPIELNTEKAKELLRKTIQKGFCDNNYKWLRTKSLLAYFADRTSEYLELGKGEYDNQKKISWKPFEILFNKKGLAGAKRDYEKTGLLPIDYKEIDKLFE